MKPPFLKILKTTVFLLIVVSAFFTSHAAAETFSRNLKLGDSGPEIFLLQKTLNQDTDTRLALSGPGSPGKETEYFGPLTKAAVERFQKKYFKDILAPLGLTSPTGFVGSLTRAKLNLIIETNKTSTAPPYQSGVSSNSSSANTSLPASGASSLNTQSPNSDSGNSLPSNPNLVNIDFYLENIAKLEREQGLDEATIQEHARIIREFASTSTDFRTQFEQELKKNLINQESSFNKLLDVFFGWIAKPANASGVPFGGPILYALPCTCSPVYSLAIGPPSTASILNYRIGTQAYLSKNLPAARFLLGFFTPGVQSCMIFVGLGCVFLPAYGEIQPMVGSSPL